MMRMMMTTGFENYHLVSINVTDFGLANKHCTLYCVRSTYKRYCSSHIRYYFYKNKVSNEQIVYCSTLNHVLQYLTIMCVEP
jgi:hypothetical protein